MLGDAFLSAPLPQWGRSQINIPAVHLDPMVIYYGSSDWVLNRGIGNLSWTSLPVGGKNTLSVLTGHSGLANQIYFDNISI